MADLFTPFIIITLIVIVILQAVERHIYARQMQAEQSKLITAFLSKNATEYVSALKTGQEKPNPLPTVVDEVELSNANEDEFDNFIKQQNKKTK